MKVRLPQNLREQIFDASLENNRSMNSEIVSRLEESFVPSDSLPVLKVELNTNGEPISWDEIYEHVTAITNAGKLNAVQLHVNVFTPELLSSLGRKAEADALAEKYRSLKKARRPA